MSFYNTTGEYGALLDEYRRTAKSQEESVLAIFKDKNNGMTPSEVYEEFNNPRVPITSIRRAITNIMNDGFVVKTDMKRRGLYGRPEREYRLVFVKQNAVQTSLF